MEKDFLKLISILIGQEPSHLVSEDQEKLHDLSQRFNEALRITRVEEKFHTNMMFDNKNYLIPPVPFASTNKEGKPLAFAFLGLNPKLFLENDTTINEKLHAGETWMEYANSYITNQRNEPNIGNFYQKLTVLMESLKNGELVKWTEVVRGCNTAQDKLATYLNIVEKDPIFVGEFIPLHSSKIGAYNRQTVQMLFQKVKEYKPYLTELFNIISNNLASDGWLIANGSGASATLETFIENNWLEGNFYKILDKRVQAYTGYVWEHNGVYRKVLLLHQFLGAIGGKLNKYEDIEKMVINVVHAFNSSPSFQEVEIRVKDEVEVEIEEMETDLPIDNGFESFGEYAAVADKIDQFILKGMGDPAHRMINITDGVAYNQNPDKQKNGFAKLSNNREPHLILRFGKKSAGDHRGIVKQIEFDRKFEHQKKRNLNHIYDYPNEAFIYLKDLADNDNQQTWEIVEENILEAFRVYYKEKRPKTFIVKKTELNDINLNLV